VNKGGNKHRRKVGGETAKTAKFLVGGNPKNTEKTWGEKKGSRKAKRRGLATRAPGAVPLLALKKQEKKNSPKKHGV